MQPDQFLISLGLIFLLGLATDFLGRRTALPRITLLIVFGIVIGEFGLDVLPLVLTGNFEIITDLAMVMIGFLLGGKLTWNFLKDTAGAIFSIATWAAVGSVVIVTAGLYLLNIPIEICIILGCISAATDPAATTEVIRELRIKNSFTDLLYAVVAVDDLIGILLFGIGLSIVSTISADGAFLNTLVIICRELFGAILLGAVLGLPASLLTGRIKKGEPMLMEALALVFLCGGLAIWLEVSIIIASITMGAMISNFATHHRYPFHAIEDIEWPVLVVFFTLAGASLNIIELKNIGLIGIVYLLCRSAGKFAGAWAGAWFAGLENYVKRWSGPAMLPQAGIAMGMSLIAAAHYPEYRQLILPVVISTTVVFEIVGPLITRLCVIKTAPFAVKKNR